MEGIRLKNNFYYNFNINKSIAGSSGRKTPDVNNKSNRVTVNYDIAAEGKSGARTINEAKKPISARVEGATPAMAERTISAKPKEEEALDSILNFSKNSLIQGVIFSEILGKPKSLRR
jgi:hypothetical protein